MSFLKVIFSAYTNTDKNKTFVLANLKKQVLFSKKKKVRNPVKNIRNPVKNPNRYEKTKIEAVFNKKILSKKF